MSPLWIKSAVFGVGIGLFNLYSVYRGKAGFIEAASLAVISSLAFYILCSLRGQYA